MAEYLRREDYDNYGSELLDVSARAAMQAVAPHLQQLEQSNAELRQRLAVEARRSLDQRVERAVPNYQEIDRDPRWHSWLSGVDALSGRARQVLLNDAVASGDAGRIAAFFRKFQSEAGATQSAPAHSERTRSAPSGRQTYTRPQIAALYEQHRKGLWAGREDEWRRLEADFCAASAEGRIQGADYLTK